MEILIFVAAILGIIGVMAVVETTAVNRFFLVGGIIVVAGMSSRWVYTQPVSFYISQTETISANRPVMCTVSVGFNSNISAFAAHSLSITTNHPCKDGDYNNLITIYKERADAHNKMYGHTQEK